MKRIAYSLILIIGLITTFTFNSCTDDDGYNLGEYRLEIATVNRIDNTDGSYYLTLDNGNTLLPIAFDSYYNPQYNKRVLLNYTLLSDEMSGYDHAIKINAIQDILTTDVIKLTPENEKEIGNDPIKILSLWTGDNFLNIHFGYNTGGVKLHSVNLVENNLHNMDKRNSNNGTSTITLEFRHNTNGDPQMYGTKNYAAFDLKPYQVQNKDSLNFIIKVLDFNNESKEFPITYKYK